MRSSNTLFRLIKSLSQSEKRYFKLEASKYSGKGANDYLKLYELIDKQEKYDEEAIKKSLKGRKMLKRFAGVKNYLYNMILKSLTQYHAERNSHQKISSLLQQVDILFGKGLYKPAAKLLNKARKIADQYEKLSFQILISEWEHRFADLENKFWKTEKKMAEIQQVEQQQLDRFTLKIKMEKLHEEVVTHMYNHGMPRNTQEMQIYQKTLQHPLLQEAGESKDFYIKNLYYSLCGLCHYMSMNRETSLKYSEKRIKFLESKPEILLEENHEYAIAAFNYLQVLILTNQNLKALNQLNKILQFLEHPELNLEERSKEFFRLVKYYNSTNIHMALGNFEEVVRVSQQFKPQYKKILEADHKNRLFFVIPVNLALAHFILENYDESLYWIRSILNDRNNTIRKDSMGFVRVLHLLVQYELNNRSIMEYYIDSTHRFLVEHAKYNDFERILLRFIKQISNKGAYDEELVIIFEKTRDELAEFLGEESYAQLLLDHYHLLEWFESKIQQRPMLDIVMQKIKSKS